MLVLSVLLLPSDVLPLLHVVESGPVDLQFDSDSSASRGREEMEAFKSFPEILYMIAKAVLVNHVERAHLCQKSIKRVRE